MELLDKLEKAASMALDDYFELREMLNSGKALESNEVKAKRILVKEGFKPLSAAARLRATLANEESNRLIAHRMALSSGDVVSQPRAALEAGAATRSKRSVGKEARA